MKTELRFALAVFLMLIVLIGTNKLFPPAQPEGGAVSGVPDTVAVAERDTGARSTPSIPSAGAPNVSAPSAGPPPPEEAEAGPSVREVVVETPLYRIGFSTAGARMMSVQLPQFPSLHQEGVVDLVPGGAEGYLGHELVVGTDTIDLRSVPFSVEPENGLTLREGSAPATITFVYQHPTADFRFTVEYTFDADRYVVDVRGSVEGVDDPILVTDLGEGLAFAEADSAQEARVMAYVYNHLQDGITSTRLGGADARIVGGPLLWAAFKNKFFVLALLSGDGTEAEASAQGHYLGGLIVRPGGLDERVRLGAAQAVGNDDAFGYRLFMGPQEYARLSSLGQGMDEVNPYGWRFLRPVIRPLVSIIMTILVFLHTQLTWSYGWVLIVFGVLMRIVLFPLNQKAMKAQLRNMAVQPLVQEIQKKYKDNPEKLQKEMLKLHKEHGFNPLAGCLPMLLPWPVLVALFFVFQNTIELRGVSFLWLPDLSAKDPFYVLPVLLALSMFLMQWISMRSLDQANQQMKTMMYVMPPVMLFIFSNLASGLNLYYATANIATIPQQFWIANERKKMRGKAPPKLSSD